MQVGTHLVCHDARERRLAEARRPAEDDVVKGLVAVARGFAAIAGRDYVLPDDVKTAAVPVLAHRLVFQNSLFRQKDMGQARIEELLETLPVPSEQIDFRRRG
jgi:MoxR-like ATPase